MKPQSPFALAVLLCQGIEDLDGGCQDLLIAMQLQLLGLLGPAVASNGWRFTQSAPLHQVEACHGQDSAQC